MPHLMNPAPPNLAEALGPSPAQPGIRGVPVGAEPPDQATSSRRAVAVPQWRLSEPRARSLPHVTVEPRFAAAAAMAALAAFGGGCYPKITSLAFARMLDHAVALCCGGRPTAEAAANGRFLESA